MAQTHYAGTVCPGCKIKLQGAHPEIAHWYNSCIKPAFPDSHVCWAFRGEEDQNHMQECGLSKVRWPNSKHNKKDAQCRASSEALDLFRLTDKGADFSKTYYAKIAEHSAKSGYAGKIKWGSMNGKDLDHFEMIIPKPKGATNG